jgi:hypothetical protein
MARRSRTPILISTVVVAACLAILVPQGCSGKPTGEINGNVICGGIPVLWGEVMLQDPDGHCVSGAIDHGHFTIVNAPLGAMQVTVTGLLRPPVGDRRDVQKRLYEEMEKAKKKAEAAGKTFTADDYDDPNGVPKKYSVARTSGLTFEVKPGHQNFDLELEATPAE